MLSTYATLFSQISTDIVAVWGVSSTEIYFGRPLQPKTTYPFSVVELVDSGVQRVRSGVRARAEEYTFEIMGAFAWPSSTSGGLLALQLAKAKLLGDRLTPSVTEAAGVIASPSAYAGIGRGMFVPQVQCPPAEQGDAFYTVIVTFTVTVDAGTE